MRFGFVELMWVMMCIVAGLGVWHIGEGLYMKAICELLIGGYFMFFIHYMEVKEDE